jgi:carbamoyltransferase
MVLAEDQHLWFEFDGASPYMLFASPASDRCASLAPAVVHVDGTARLQTIEDDHVLAKVLRLFRDATGVPVLINSSLNGPGEPIAQTHHDTLAFCRENADVVPYLDGVRIGD